MDEPTTKGSLPDDSGPEAGRRRLLKALTVSAGAAAAAAVLPKDWVKPVVDAVDVPLHAQGTASLTISNLILTPPAAAAQSVSGALAGNWTARFTYQDLLALLGPDNTRLFAQFVNTPSPPTCAVDIHRFELIAAVGSMAGGPAMGTISFPFAVPNSMPCGVTNPFVWVMIQHGGTRNSNELFRRLIDEV